MSKRFQRKIEDFVCENCGLAVAGNGYTDHCPNCLYSKHVDINPGDRESECLGIMEPVGVETLRDGYKINYICQKCGYRHRVKSVGEDSVEAMIRLSGKC